MFSLHRKPHGKGLLKFAVPFLVAPRDHSNGDVNVPGRERVDYGRSRILLLRMI